jgi:hypothetical protein
MGPCALCSRFFLLLRLFLFSFIHQRKIFLTHSVIDEKKRIYQKMRQPNEYNERKGDDNDNDDGDDDDDDKRTTLTQHDRKECEVTTRTATYRKRTSMTNVVYEVMLLRVGCIPTIRTMYRRLMYRWTHRVNRGKIYALHRNLANSS